MPAVHGEQRDHPEHIRGDEGDGALVARPARIKGARAPGRYFSDLLPEKEARGFGAHPVWDAACFLAGMPGGATA